MTANPNSNPNQTTTLTPIGMRVEVEGALSSLIERRSDMSSGSHEEGLHILICHSTPEHWVGCHTEDGANDGPRGDFKSYRVGRTMSETDRVPEAWLQQLQETPPTPDP